MKQVATVCRKMAFTFLTLLLLAGVFAGRLAPHPYAEQSREYPNAKPSRQFPLGTDDLGRDRFSRLMYGTRVSLLLAPAAALLSIAIAVLVGGFAAYAGALCERISIGAIDLLLALPTILILLTVRAMMPLNVSAWASISITCVLLGALNWPAAARVIRADMNSLLRSEFVRQSQATGASPRRILWKQIVPNFRPLLIAQFWLLVPAFILTEANLSLLGLGVTEPMPSWGNMLRELENYSAIPDRPWVLVPLVVLILSVLSLYLVLPAEEES